MYNKNTKFLIDTNEPFKGSVISSITVYPFVDYSGSLHNQNGEITGKAGENITLEQYLAMEQNTGKQLKIISDAELTHLLEAYMKSLYTKVKQISEDDYYYFLEVLPPCNWHNIGGANVFYMSEFLTGNLTSWYININNEYFYTFDGRSTLTDQEIVKKMDSEELTKHNNLKNEYA